MKKNVLIFLVYLIITFLYTYPLIFKLGRAIYGYAGDNLGAIHYFWWWKYSFLNHLDLRNSFLEQAPFGYRLDAEPGSILYYWPLKILTLAFEATAAYNLVLILSFPLAALAMFLLTKSLTSNSLISFWAGFVYSFSPYHFWKAYNHLDLALIWAAPLTVLVFFKLLSELRSGRTLTKNSFWAGLLIATTILTNLYYGYFLVLTLGLLFLLSSGVFRIKTSSLLVSAITILILGALFSIPFLAPSLKNALIEKGAGQSLARQASYERPLLDLVSLSARPWDYFIPAQDNPFFGSLSKNFYAWIVTKGSDFKVVSGPVHERTIFLGFVPLIFLGINLYLLFRSQDFRIKFGQMSLLLVLVAVGLFVISLPPYIFIKGRTFYLPGFFLYKLVPTFRTYSRLGIFILMLVVPVAGLSLSYLCRKASRKKMVILFSIIMALSALEFLNVPPSKVEALKMPRALEFVAKKAEPFNIVVYPKEFNVADLLVFQPQFQKGFLNFHSQSPYYRLWDDLADFRNPKTAQILAGLGIRYALFQKKLVFAKPNPVDDLWYTRSLKGDLGSLNDGFKVVADFDDSAVYQVVAPAAAFVVTNGLRLDVFPRGEWLWPQAEGKIYLGQVGSAKSRVDLSLTKIPGSVFDSINYNGKEIKESAGSFRLDNLKAENFLKISTPNAGPVAFRSLKGHLVN